MTYKIPSNKEIVKAMANSYCIDEFPSPDRCLKDFYSDLETTSKMASLNFHKNREYLDYLEYFKRFIRSSINNPQSYLRKTIEEYYHLKRLHQIL